mmetsp:Transcript_109203/g.315534  ORF Transcript_109203/g.315534 Transcript_109203/m.315534 type:complete len:231 (-) Transcript_109203:118-810(-)|eukprot:CAMPEP_0176007990 /NCGR_PEP_ID=MMETSP0120_2-20121206/3516_1 /TAXON_ID=160619 /ORGANISM="Kryptoperidinium foliaceum, Strain CCMP 1326" /LENGTH=230 /DNA_ID=CAMNT_0017340765 /DNA_START=141 /DNA_END=833 /DNA_ORIENTATION=-
MLIEHPQESPYVSNEENVEQAAVEFPHEAEPAIGSGELRLLTTESTKKRKLLAMVDALMESPPPPRKRSRSVSIHDDDEDAEEIKRRTRTVHFSENVTSHPVLCRQEMSCDEISNAWMDRFDRSENRKDISSTIYLMRSGLSKRLSDDDFFCSRGLEHLLHSKDDASPCRKSIGIALAMQRVLRKAGVTSPDMIARAYGKYTINSRQAAYKKALYDEAFVTHEYNEEMTR